MIMSRIKELLRNSKITGNAYLFIGRHYYELYYTLKKKRMARAMKKNSKRTIGQLQSIFEKTGLLFFFDMGTLLGIVRDGKLMKYDYDIDMAVKTSSENEKKEIRKLLIENGCKLLIEDIVDEIGTVEESYKLNGIKFDVNYYVSEERKDVCYLLYKDPESIAERLNVVKLSCDIIERTIKVPFQELLISVPENPEEYLAQRYGDNWRIPDKGYVYWKGPSTSKISNLGDQIHCK